MHDSVIQQNNQISKNHGSVYMQLVIGFSDSQDVHTHFPGEMRLRQRFAEAAFSAGNFCKFIFMYMRHHHGISNRVYISI